MNKPLISIIIPVFNQWDFTRACLRSLKEHSAPDFQVIVVDNGSFDATQTELDSLGKSLWAENFHSIRLPENLGFAAACNLGAKKARSDLFFFLNNDTLLTSNWLEPILEKLAENAIGATGPLLLYPGHERVQHLGVTYVPGPHAVHLHEFFPAEHYLVHKERDVQSLTAAALGIRKDIFWDHGGFAECYKNGCEDLELCLKLINSGYRLQCAPASRIYHYTSQTENRFGHESQNSGLLFARQGQNIRPDIHKHALADGYTLKLNDWLLPYIALDPGNCSRINDRARDMSPGDWLTLLQKEPLWVDGYDMLAAYLEKNRSYADALQIRFLGAHFGPSRKNHLALLRCAEKAQAREMAASTLETLQNIATAAKNARTKAQKNMARAKEKGESFLVQLYFDWLESNPKTNS